MYIAQCSHHGVICLLEMPRLQAVSPSPTPNTCFPQGLFLHSFHFPPIVWGMKTYTKITIAVLVTLLVVSLALIFFVAHYTVVAALAQLRPREPRAPHLQRWQRPLQRQRSPHGWGRCSGFVNFPGGKLTVILAQAIIWLILGKAAGAAPPCPQNKSQAGGSMASPRLLLSRF